jgi:hypothetical protein
MFSRIAPVLSQAPERCRMAVGLAKTRGSHEWLKPGAWGCKNERASRPKRRGRTGRRALAPRLYMTSRERPRRSVSRSRFRPNGREILPSLITVIVISRAVRDEQCAVGRLHTGDNRRH